MATPKWPELSYDGWKDTCETLHLWTQIVGKIRLVQVPWINHSWSVTLYVTARGLTTGPMPWEQGSFEIDFDFLEHQVLIETSRGGVRTIALRPRSVADFYREIFDKLAELGPRPKIHARPNEVEIATPFAEDREHASYDAEAVGRFFAALSAADLVFKKFRSGFLGKCSPVHFFWGGFDLAVTRFSGRPAPLHPGGPPNCPAWVNVEAYSREVSSCGFWPGSPAMPVPVFYSYAYPEPAGFRDSPVGPAGASYNGEMGEFLLPYDEARRASSPEQAVLEFCQSAYEAAAINAKWDRRDLERDVE
ncbi:MAG: DUF5996 family protein [Thermoanaerobaculia bacterium]